MGNPVHRRTIGLVVASAVALWVGMGSVNRYRAYRHFAASLDPSLSPEDRLPLLEEAVRLDPGNATYLRDAGGRCLEIAQDRPEQAEAMMHNAERYLRATVRSEPTQAAGHYQLGHYYFIRKDFRQAEKEFDKALSLAPCNAYFFEQVGLRDLERRQNRRWIAEFRRAIELNPGSTQRIVEALWSASNDPYALRALAGDSWRLRLSMVHFLETHEQPRAALQQCLAFCRDAKTASPDTRRHLALFLRELGQPLLALSFLERWLADCPNNAVLRRELATTLLAGGDSDRALAVATELAGDPHCDDATCILLGIIQQQRGDLAAAAAAYRQAIAIRPRRLRHHLKLVDVLCRAQKLDEALEAAEAMLLLLPRCAEAHAALGSVYLARRDLRLAHHAYEDAVRLDPSNGAFRARLADIKNALAEKAGR